MFFELERRRRRAALLTASSSPTRPRQFGGFPAFQIAPPLPFIPEDRHGDTFLAFIVVLGGSIDEGEAALEAVARRRPRSSPNTSARCRTRRSTARSTRCSRQASSTTGRRTSSPSCTDAAIDAHLRARTRGPGRQLDTAHLSDQRRCHRVASGRDRVRLPRCDLRHRHRRHVAGPGRQRGEHPLGPRLLRRDRAAAPRTAATSTSWPTTTRIGSRRTTAQLRPPRRGQADIRPRQPVPPEPEHPP